MSYEQNLIAVRDAQIALLEASSRRLMTQLADYRKAIIEQEVELAQFHKLGAKFVVLGYKLGGDGPDASPAYISEEHNTFAEAEKDLVAAGYPIGQIDIVLKVENIRQGYLVIDRG